MLHDAATRSPGSLSLSRTEWEQRRHAHQIRLNAWTKDRVSRAGVAEKHPVYDFLFTYYSFRPAHLLRWSPGADVELQGISESELDWPLDSVNTGAGYSIPALAFPKHRHTYLEWAHRYLTRTGERSASFGCFGLHEWAMVYKAETPRHTQVPLRLTPAEIADVVERGELRCSHYDAYRFFTPEAVPLNKTALSRHATPDFDQPGCIHVTMDLYKFAHKISPWCPSELVADTFLLAVAAREIDMRASPYDLVSYGFEPIKIEEPSGRIEYIAAQRDLSERAAPLRARLLEVYSYLLSRTRVGHELVTKLLPDAQSSPSSL